MEASDVGGIEVSGMVIFNNGQNVIKGEPKPLPKKRNKNPYIDVMLDFERKRMKI